jgi:hypothetical protein
VVEALQARSEDSGMTYSPAAPAAPVTPKMNGFCAASGLFSSLLPHSSASSPDAKIKREAVRPPPVCRLFFFSIGLV